MTETPPRMMGSDHSSSGQFLHGDRLGLGQPGISAPRRHTASPRHTGFPRKTRVNSAVQAGCQERSQDVAQQTEPNKRFVISSDSEEPVSTPWTLVCLPRSLPANAASRPFRPRKGTPEKHQKKQDDTAADPKLPVLGLRACSICEYSPYPFALRVICVWRFIQGMSRAEP